MPSSCPSCGTAVPASASYFCPECMAPLPKPDTGGGMEGNIVKDSSVEIETGGQASLKNNILKDSHVKITGGGSGAAPTGTSGQSGFNATLNGNVIGAGASVHIEQKIINVTSKPGVTELENKMAEIFDYGGWAGIESARASLLQLGRDHGLPDSEISKLLKAAQEHYRQLEEDERNRAKYRLRRAGQVSGPLNLEDLVDELNKKALNTDIPEVDIDERGPWKTAWSFEEIARHPRLKRFCWRGRNEISAAEARVCARCGLMFRKTLIDPKGHCPVCASQAEGPAKPRVETATPTSASVDLSLFDMNIWKRIPAGSFQMGSPDSEAGRHKDERQHPVTITRDFLVFYTPVTEAFYEEVLDIEGSRKFLPKTGLTWFDAVRFCNALSLKMKLSPCYEIGEGAGLKADSVLWKTERAGIRLLTEAEWEYACRAGSTGPYYEGSEDNFYEYGHYDLPGLEPVGHLKPNALQLYDMLGLVREWVWDGRGDYPSGDQAEIDPGPQKKGDWRVNRGGSIEYTPLDCRCARRFSSAASDSSECLGFRIGLTI